MDHNSLLRVPTPERNDENDGLNQDLLQHFPQSNSCSETSDEVARTANNTAHHKSVFQDLNAKDLDLNISNCLRTSQSLSNESPKDTLFSQPKLQSNANSTSSTYFARSTIIPNINSVLGSKNSQNSLKDLSNRDQGDREHQLSRDPIESDDDLPSSNSEDEFISSDDESLNRGVSGKHFNSLGCGTTFSEHVLYFEKALDVALGLQRLDKSFVAQAQLSGHLNDTNRLLLEKQEELQKSLQRLRVLYDMNITSKRIDVLGADLKQINTRIKNLKHGQPKSRFFAKRHLGVVDKFPVEYNQARDKVLERPEET